MHSVSYEYWYIEKVVMVSTSGERNKVKGKKENIIKKQWSKLSLTVLRY